MYCTLKVLWSTVIAVISAVESQAFILVQVSPLTSSVMLGSYFIQVYFPTYNTGRKMSTLKACHENI